MVEEKKELPVIVRRPASTRALTLAKDRWPALITEAGPAAQERFLEFFAATIRNKNTRVAYFHAITLFFRWAEKRGLHLGVLRENGKNCTLRSLRKTNYFTYSEYRVMLPDEGTFPSGGSQPLRPDQRPPH